LTEEGLDQLVASGCAACRSTRLAFRTYVDARLPLMGGEPVGPLTWAYDGEKFVDGVFEATCADCRQVVFTSDVCPRCNAAGGLASALSAQNRWPPPPACPGCQDEDIFYVAMVPAHVAYDGRRAEKARTTTELYDPGFHAFRVDCGTCGTVAELTEACPLCRAPGPLRPRP
jgi:hypothetical protein